jgi:DNA-binding transcriptional ArsR family regulator
MATLTAPLEQFEARAEEVAATLKVLASGPRLTVLCKLVEHGELCVGDLADAVGLSQSALSQHLARMREEHIVTFRREGHSLFYSVADPRCEALLVTLHRLYCSERD